MGDHAPIVLPQPGDVLDGKYTILRVVGEGGMGVVFEATHVKLSQRVAIKVLQPLAAGNPGIVSRFEREARAAGRLRGKHVARVTDVEVSPDKLPYMVMEFLEGHDLDTELEQRGPLPIEEAVDMVLQACKGVAEAHLAGIIHRDLKPSNLFLCHDGDQRVVKLLDFGISKVADDASKLTSTELTVGTLLYMSPEQVRSAKDVDTRTDVWALGVIMYEVLAGVPPFVGSAPAVAAAIVTDEPPPLSGLRGDVPEGLAAIIRKAMSKRPSDRFADVPAFAAAIAPYGPLDARTSSARFLAAARVASSPSLPHLDPELQNAKTMVGAPPPRSSPEVAAIAGTSPGWVTRTTPRNRSRAPWLALGGAALLVLVGAAAFFRMRPGRTTAGAPPQPSAIATTLAPATATGDPTTPTVAVTSSATPSASAQSVAVVPTLASGPKPAQRTTRPNSTTNTTASATPTATSAPPPPPAPKKKDKAPLVAPF